MASWALGAAAGCSSRSAPEGAPARLPTEKEAAAEKVVVNYGPRRLRVFPAASTQPGSPQQGFLILASERPELPALFRPLGVTAQRPAAGFLARAGTLAWVAGHVVEALPGSDPLLAPFLVYDRDGKVGTPVSVQLPAACPQTAQRLPLLQGDGDKIHALVRCAAASLGDGHSLLLTLDGEGRLLSGRAVPHKDEPAVELYLHQPDADYLVAGALLLRADTQSQSLLSAQLPSRGTEETGELVRAGTLLLVVDGVTGRVLALDARTLAPRFEKRFAGGSKSVTRLRAALGAPERLDLVTAEKTAAGAALFATSLRLDEQPAPPASRLRLDDGLGPKEGAPADHELVAVSPEDGGGVLLVYTHRGNTGPQVALRRLTL